MKPLIDEETFANFTEAILFVILHIRIFWNLALSDTDHQSYKKKMETQIDLIQKRHSFSKEFKLKVMKYYHNNMKIKKKTATHFNLDGSR